MKKYVAFLFCFIGLPFLLMVGATQSVYAVPIEYIADLNGASEEPPNASPGTGFAKDDFDIDAHTMYVHVEFSGLLGTTTASHIHGPTALPGIGNAGVATQTPSFLGFPLGVTSGTYDHSFWTDDSTTYNPAFITAQGSVAAAEEALALALEQGKAYLNIHTTFRPGGEIRGFLAQPVPEPSTMLLLGSGLIGLAGLRKKFKK